jgi:tetratricopeptide (TPR) repeat protein
MSVSIEQISQFKDLLLKHFQSKSNLCGEHGSKESKNDQSEPNDEQNSDKDSDDDRLMNDPEKNPAKSHGYSCMNDHSKEINLYEKTNKEKFEAIELFKQQGDMFVGQKDFAQAKSNYKRALVYTNYLIPSNGEEQIRFDFLLLRIHLNTALVRIELFEIRKALSVNIEFVLSKDPKNPKALYRKAKCYLVLDEYENCKQVIEQISEINNGILDPDTLRLSEDLTRKVINYKNTKMNVRI